MNRSNGRRGCRSPARASLVQPPASRRCGASTANCSGAELGGFEGHSGYTGVFFGLPGLPHHLEFTQHEDGSPSPAPTKDNLLVLYFSDALAVDAIVERLTAAGHPPVEPENPYWTMSEDGVTVEDPDGWRVVLVKPRG